MENLPVESQNQFITFLEKCVNNSDVDVSKLTALLDAQERILASQNEALFNQALARLQEKLPRIKKNGAILYEEKGNKKAAVIKFAKYEDIDIAIRKLLQEEGFSVSFDTTWSDSVIMTGVLLHSAGHKRTSSIRLPLDSSGGKNNLQGMGSTISYGKRYILTNLLNLVYIDEDDDGEAHKLHSMISPAQVQELSNLLDEVKGNKQAFCKLLKINSLAELPQTEWQNALNLINKKRGAKK